MSRVKVLIVDDSLTVRQALSEILASDPEIQVVATAGDAMTAADRIKEQTPDVITLDIEMPHMDGLTFLHMIMTLKPIPVVICSSQVSRATNSVLALEYGAVDIIAKPQVSVRTFFEESRIMICDTVKAAARAKLRVIGCTPPHRQVDVERPSPPIVRARPELPVCSTPGEKVIVVGASTGGTDALKVFLRQMPPDAPGILVVQHMPENFTRGFAERLDGLCAVHVKEAENSDRVEPGLALIAPGNQHMLLKRGVGGYFAEVRTGPLVSRHRPSVDVLFKSAARYAGANAIGVIMTGMGDDGAVGMREMKEAGAFNVAQDEATCAVFGMPNEAIKHGGVDVVLPLDDIARKVLDKV
ncbi:chemotaxis response regulator protein-glutamate methylesterase [Geobacter sp. DSM 9736]|uniref:protein-glutamate methylesterase/protein-glutamine glutaminase n=1 Tax=Geobacter sp. DSM 9736 TaxID=1277350 RepID=UPI000B504525|nr:chemotaxis response regulator protein-glutamate methylesterase [Geobacter sp. DSM 9736]SNB46662.1 two-component system, chemotaxis family, response regulator CheB [Geobacter sp. DSM 9736]